MSSSTLFSQFGISCPPRPRDRHDPNWVWFQNEQTHLLAPPQGIFITHTHTHTTSNESLYVTLAIRKCKAEHVIFLVF